MAGKGEKLFNVVKVSDGLGNQLFQYAFARKLQLIGKGNVYLDIRYINNEDRIARGEKNIHLKKNDYRLYSLDKFRITVPIADDKILSGWNYLIPHNQKERVISAFARSGLWFCQYRDEEKVRNGKLLNSASLFLNTYFQGYYFNLKYYDDIRMILQKEFCLKTPLKLSKRLKYVLSFENTVGIHIRRGDFVKLHYSISNDKYYIKAMKRIEELVSDPIYLVFSDDIDWVKKHLKINGTVIYISDMGYKDYEEFTIMKHCRHDIIANSTFSYWAAYLNQNQGKNVIYPKTWEKHDIIPDGWIAM